MRKSENLKAARAAAVAMVASAILGCAGEEKSAVVGLDIAPCDPGFEGVEADCGQLRVYENRETKSGRIIPINFIRVRSTGEETAPDVVIQLSGGPGENSSPNAGAAIARSRTLGARDLLIVDQRGTGESNPLDCNNYDLQARPEAFAEMFEKSFFDVERFRACKDRLSDVADLKQYTTSIIADDINDLRAALDYERMTLIGGSYGTTLGLEIIRRHGSHVRAAVFRGVIPPSINQTETLARDMQDMLDALFAACAADVACAERYPTFEADLYLALDRAREATVEVTLPHTLTQAPTTVRVRYEELAVGLRYGLYSTQVSAGLPFAAAAAKAGDYVPLAQLLPQLLYLLSNIASEGMWASVRCAEEFPFIDQERARRLSADTVLGETRLQSGNEICAFWPQGQAAENFHEPVVSDVPVLILAGEVDASTPPWMAEEAARHLSKGRLVLIPNRSHWGLGGDDCIEGLIVRFVEDPDPERLDAACVANYQRPPFAIGSGE